MTPTLNEEKSALLRKWREDCRVNLLELEKKSIHVRVSVFEKIINEKTTQVNRMLCVDKNEGNEKISPYKHYTDSEQQCKFIENWNGLNTNQMRSLPKSLQEYENRAKNWLNGRRAINYAQNLFPEMILCAEHYAVAVAKKLFPDNKLQQELYGDILLYSYISGICCGRVALYDGHHRASLICENSIKKEGNLKRLLQKYFDGDEIEAYSFPKHLQDAIDYFKNKYHEKLNEFQTKYTHRQFYEKSTSSSSGANKNKPSTSNNNNNSNSNNNDDNKNNDNSRNNDSQSIVSSRSRPSMRNNNTNNSSRNMRNNNNHHNNHNNNRSQRRTTTSSTSQYGGDRGGSYIGSASQFRSNPMKYSNNPMENLMRTIDEANIELPPPMDHVNANNTNNNNNNNNSINTNTNNNMSNNSMNNNNMNVNRNNNMNNNMNLNNPQNINNIMMNMRNQYGLNTPTNNNNMMNNNYSMQMNSHRSSVGSLVTKFNNIRRRNVFLEQEIKNYKEQQRLDHERIKLLEDQIALLQRTNSTAYDTISDDYGTRQSPSTSIQHSNSDISNDASTFFAFNNTTNSNTASTNDDVSTMEMNNLPALPMTNLTPTSNLNLKINDFPSVDSMNQHLMGNNANMFTQQQMNNMNNMNNNMNMNNHVNMNINNRKRSPMPLQTLGLNFDNTSYLPSTPIPSNTHNPSLFGPIGGATGEFELDAMDYTQPIPNNY